MAPAAAEARRTDSLLDVMSRKTTTAAPPRRGGGRRSGAEREPEANENDEHEHDTGGAHQARVRHRTRALRFDAGDGGDRREQRGRDEPRVPGHTSATCKTRAAQQLGIWNHLEFRIWNALNAA